MADPPPATLDDSPKRHHLIFDVRGQSVQLTVSLNGTYCVEMDWQEPHDRLEIRPRSFCPQGLHRQRMEEVEWDDAGMQRFWCYSNLGVDRTRTMFGWHAQKCLEDIADFFELADFQILIHSSKFTVKKRLKRELGTRTAELVRLAISFREFLVHALDSCQEFADMELDESCFLILPSSNSPIKGELETECQVCGQGLDENLVSCVTCETLHHKDCWEYNGRCATFGCRQHEYADCPSSSALSSTAQNEHDVR